MRRPFKKALDTKARLLGSMYVLMSEIRLVRLKGKDRIKEACDVGLYKF